MGRVVVFSITGCPHCRRVKSLLAKKGAPYHDVNLDEFPSRRAEMVAASGGKKTVPQVFLNGLHVGGNADVEAADAAGRLDAMLETALTEPDADGAPLTSEQYVERHGRPEVKAEESEAVDEEALLVDTLTRELRAVLHIKDRRYRLVKYSRCFVGCEAVDWLVEHKGLSRAGAVETMRMLYRRKAIHHVVGEHKFQDAELFYRFQEDEETHVLNMSRLYDGKARPAGALAGVLRKQILALYNKHLSEDGMAVDYEGMKESTRFREYCRVTTELQGVQLDTLTRDEALAFYINVYNALVIHAHVTLGKPTSLWGRLRFFDKVAYNIGGMHLSLNDIEQGILRGNRVGPGEWRKRFRSNSDPRMRLVMDPMDSRIHFALVCGAKSCPPIKLYSPDNVQEALTLAAQAFVEDDGNFHVDEAARVVTVSKIFGWYKKDFGDSLVDACHWAMQYLPTAKKAALGRLLHLTDDAEGGGGCKGSKVKLKYFPYDWGDNSTANSKHSQPPGSHKHAAGAGGGTGAGAAAL